MSKKKVTERRLVNINLLESALKPLPEPEVIEPGEKEIRRLYRALYTGILEEYRRDDIEFVPHLGLGLFIKEGSKYNWDNPHEGEFDEERYREALQQASALPLGSSCAVDRLHLTKIPDEVLEWATGIRASIPEDAQVVEVREFRLG